MSKKLSIDRTVNGTALSQEDPMKIRLKHIAQSRVSVPPPDLIIKKIKEKLEQRVIMGQTNKPLKSTMIRIDTDGVPINFNTDQQLNVRSTKYKSIKDTESQNKGWNNQLNIPYYRKIMKIPLAQLKHELENIVSPPPETMKASMSVQNLLPSSFLADSKHLPPIQTATTYLDERNVKISLQQYKDEFYSQSKSRQVNPKFQTKTEKTSLIGADMLVSGSTMTTKNYHNSVENEPSTFNKSIEKRNTTQQKYNFTTMKARKNLSQDNSIVRTKEDHLPNINTYQDLQINSIKGTGEINQQDKNDQDARYLSLINSKRAKFSQKKVNQALMRWNEQRIRDRYNGQILVASTGDQVDLIGDCLRINQPVEDESQMNISGKHNGNKKKVMKGVPSVENLMKQLNL